MARHMDGPPLDAATVTCMSMVLPWQARGRRERNVEEEQIEPPKELGPVGLPPRFPMSGAGLFSCGLTKSMVAVMEGDFLPGNEPSRAQAELLEGIPYDLAVQILTRVNRVSLPAVRGVCRTWKAFVESREFLEARKAMATCEDWVYVVGETTGHDHPQLLALDPVAAKYHHLTSLPPKLFAPSLGLGSKLGPLQRQDFGLVALGHEVVMFGAYASSRVFSRRSGGVWRYNVLCNRWRRAAEMLTPRAGFACGTVEGKVYVAGGRDHNGVATTSAEVYDPVTDTWEALPPMPSAKHICTGAVLDGKLYVLGCGDQWRCQPQNLLQPIRMEVLDPATLSWTTSKVECPAPKVWGVPWHDQAMPVAWEHCLYWVGCGALKLRFYDAAANAFVGYFENELCAFEETAGVSGFLHGPPGNILQARESCGLAVARGELLVVGGCLFDQVGLPTVYPGDVQVHSPKSPSGDAWRTLSISGGALRVGKVWRCVTVTL